MFTDKDNTKKLLDAMSDLLFVIDLNGIIMEVNTACRSTLGYTYNELIGKPISFLYTQKDKKEILHLISEINDGVCNSYSLPFYTKAKQLVFVETKIYHDKWGGRDVIIGVSQKLAASTLENEKFYEVFDNNQAMMTISEIETGIFLDANKQFLSFFGFEKNEIIGKSAKELNLFADYKERSRVVKSIRQTGRVSNKAIKVRTREGKELICLFSFSVIKIRSLSYSLISAIDITEQKKAEEKLEHSYTHQKLLSDVSMTFLSLDHFHEKIIQILKLLGTHTDVSRVYIFEDSKDGTQTSNTYEWRNENISKQMDDLQNVSYKAFPSWKKILREEGQIFSTDIQKLPADIVAILEPQGIKSILSFPLYVQNRFVGFVGFDECNMYKSWEQEDVDLLRFVSTIISTAFERHKFQKQLYESELRKTLALENTGAGLWDWNIKTGDVFFSSTWCEMLGYTQDEIEPRESSWERLVHPDDKSRIDKVLKAHFSGETEVYETTHRVLTKSGEWKWILDKGKVVDYDSENNPLRAVGTRIDLDYQKKSEEQLKQLNATKDKFFSIIAHDLRGPIGSMMQIAELLSEKDSLNEEDLDNFLHTQKELSANTFQLLENLLNWARYNRNQMQFNPQKINLNKIIKENKISVRFQAKQKNITVITDFRETFEAFADEDMVKLIIRNLLSNALKFTNIGGTVKIDIQKKPDALEIRVADSGAGISSENIQKVLSDNDFFSTKGTNNEKGTGLGLKLCKSYITQNRGTFNIQSELNVGSVFSFTLPLVNGQLDSLT
ncbi:MAG: PAS domain S-box protein [Bacteroidaceae bacterium]|nr:PAS domain S-box protein [Bacteroidaceae bacterium]